MDFLSSLLINSAISIIGFIITICITLEQFKNDKEERIATMRNKLYVEAFKEIESIISTPTLIFDNSYYERITSYKAEMKLYASKSVLRAYRAYLSFVRNILDKYNDFALQNDPLISDRYNEVVTDDETGQEIEVAHYTELDIENYHKIRDTYCEQHLPDRKELKELIGALLNAMRADISNSPIDNDIIE